MSLYDLDCEQGCRLLRAERDKLEAVKKIVEKMREEVEDEITLHHYKREINKILGVEE